MAHVDKLREIHEALEELTYSDDGGLQFQFWHVPREKKILRRMGWRTARCTDEGSCTEAAFVSARLPERKTDYLATMAIEKAPGSLVGEDRE